MNTHTASAATISTVARAVQKSSTTEQLFEMLTEEHMFKSGDKVFIAGTMGQANVDGVFKKMTSGGFAEVETSQGVFPCMPHLVYPKRHGSWN